MKPSVVVVDHLRMPNGDRTEVVSLQHSPACLPAVSLSKPGEMVAEDIPVWGPRHIVAF